MSSEVTVITAEVEKQAPALAAMSEEIGKVIVGQRSMVEKIMIGLLAEGHILVEGVPGLAKTTVIKTLAQATQVSFQRIQFTPDLLPADLIGTQIYSPKDSSFSVKKGPIFANLILADEINRAPAKVQSALLEAMQERQVTIGEETFTLPEPFLVMATQNPIEQEGTYPLPEAQVDRFMLKILVNYPSKDDEIAIMKRMGTRQSIDVDAVLSPAQIIELRKLVDRIYIDEKLYDYIANLVLATRDPASCGLSELSRLVEYGASPRASIYLLRSAKAYALLQGRGFVTPQDIKMIGMDVLRHRLLVTYEAEARDTTSDDLIMKIFDKVDVP